MNLRRLLFILASATALAVSAGVVVVALAFALYAWVKPLLGQAGGAAVVAAAAAILIALLGLILGAAGKRRRRRALEPQSFIDRVVEMVRERPVVALAGAVAAGLLAVRNPHYLGALIRAFVDGRDPNGR